MFVGRDLRKCSASTCLAALCVHSAHFFLARAPLGTWPFECPLARWRIQCGFHYPYRRVRLGNASPPDFTTTS